MFGGFTAGKIGNLAAWTPIDNAFEYDPVNDSWKALAPMPTKRGAAVAATVGGKMYVIGGATTAPGATNPAIHPNIAQRVLSTVEEYDPETNTWRDARPHAHSAQPHGRGRRGRKDLCDRRTDRRSVHRSVIRSR